ncbi:MAG: cupin domain-containing protein [Rhodobacterales bacterium]|nr:cupin domain-containing protein [Pseudomonadota bacterium]MDA1287486.1 cupin domain-containing protein [Pseudomonadota bacterium]
MTQTQTPEIDRPTPDRLISGDPVFSTWNLDDCDGPYCGLWQSTPGKWRIQYDEREFCHILQGHSILHEDGKAPQNIKAGDSFILRSGFKGTWGVLETTLKEYVIRL